MPNSISPALFFFCSLAVAQTPRPTLHRRHAVYPQGVGYEERATGIRYSTGFGWTGRTRLCLCMQHTCVGGSLRALDNRLLPRSGPKMAILGHPKDKIRVPMGARALQSGPQQPGRSISAKTQVTGGVWAILRGWAYWQKKCPQNCKLGHLARDTANPWDLAHAGP